MKNELVQSFKFSLKHKRYWLAPLVIWAAVVLVSLYQSITSIHEHSQEVATESARNLFNMIRLTRRWNAQHGGVYVPISNRAQPNPYLKVPKRDLVTQDELKLTLINPAYMTRQMSDLVPEGKERFHITSLNPIRPNNAPDDWERMALELFEQGVEEQILSTDTEFRYMAPLWVKKPCLKCHEQQGYEIGDVRGGISITLPKAPIFGEDRNTIRLSAAKHVVVFIIVSLLILLLLKKFRRSWQELDSVRLLQQQVINERTHALADINERIDAEVRERAKAENLYRLVSQSAPEAIISSDDHGRVISWNKGAERIFGYSEQEMLGGQLERIIPERYQAAHQKALARARKRTKLGELIKGVEIEGLANGGVEIPVEISLNDWINGEDRFFTAVIRDISERKHAEEDLRLAAKVFESTAEGVIITDPNEQIIAVNNAFTRITGYTQEELLEKRPAVLQSDRHDEPFYKAMWKELNETGSWCGEIWNRNKSGKIYPEWLSINAVRNDTDEVTHYVGVFSDISEIKRSQEQLDHLAYHDPLTDLPNRRLFKDRLKHAIERCKRHNNKLVVMFIDLDNFKDINDSLGHATGDELLRRVSKRIVSTLRSEDTVARQGGDEFIVLLEDISNIDSLKPLVEKLIEVLRKGYEFNNQQYYSSASIGLSCYPDDGKTADVLVQNADAAMYAAKESGRDNYMFYSGELTSKVNKRLRLEAGLRHALERDEFSLNYQPQINTVDGEIEGLEVLLRWNHPEMGEVPPYTFIPHAENNGLIIPIGAWVMLNACQQLVEWLKQGLSVQKIAVNVAGQQIQDSDFVQMVKDILEKTSIAPEMLELEITESFIMQRAEKAIGVLNDLKELGVHIAIDDFGTGYSSLSYIKRLPIDKLKIDRTFIRDLTIDPNDVAISKAIIALGKSMDLVILAEGVETVEQEKILKENGCDRMQGYLYSRPVAAADVSGLFEKL